MGRARAFSALKMATREVAGNTRDGSIDEGLAAAVHTGTKAAAVEGGQVGVM